MLFQLGRSTRRSKVARSVKKPQKNVKSEASLDPPLEIQIRQPRSAEDHVLIALDKSGTAAVVKILRDWVGSKGIHDALNRLPHRDPVDRFKHAIRHAVELYAKAHNITPANLMVKITGINGRNAPEASERYKLRKAREYLEKDPDALTGAKALACHWLESRPKNKAPETYIKEQKPKV